MSRWLVGLLLWSTVVGEVGAQVPQVVVSIKPVHSLVSGVMEGVGQPTLLVSGSASPHQYALKPSEVTALQEADLVFWLGPETEPFLPRFLQGLPDAVRVVPLAEAEGLTLLAPRETPGEPLDAHAEHDHTAAGPHDPHLWLSPHNAQGMVSAIAQRLVEADPEHSAQYLSNLQEVQRRLANLDLSLRQQLQPLQGAPYIVFHDAYQYFEKRYGLEPVDWIAVNPDRPPGAGHLRVIRERLQRAEVRCIFTEPQFPPKLVTALTEGMPVQQGVLDPLGADLPEGTDLYVQLLQNLGSSFVQCLQAPLAEPEAPPASFWDTMKRLLTGS